jgi:chemotaxis protein MotB
MPRKRHEEHTNHESWAIPYGDLITLLLAFFVVMYSISSVNEGKYRVLSDALSEAFGGAPRSLKPIQIGEARKRGDGSTAPISLVESQNSEVSVGGTMRDLRNPTVFPSKDKREVVAQQANPSGATGYDEKPSAEAGSGDLKTIGDQMENALSDMVKNKLVTIRRTATSLEVEITTDILFSSGSSAIAESAKPILGKVAAILKRFPNSLRIEGYTDNKPIHTFMYPSNWELSAARAATVVHLFQDQGLDPSKMTVAGFGEFRPAASNDTVEGRNRNRRVIVVVQAPPGSQIPAALTEGAAADGNAAAATADGGTAGGWPSAAADAGVADITVDSSASGAPPGGSQ